MEDQQSLFDEEAIIDPDIKFRKEDCNMDSINDARAHGSKTYKRNNRGRKHGSINERTRLQNDYILKILEGVPPEQIILDLMAMKPYERQKVLIEYREFVQPKLQRAEIKGIEPEDRVIIVDLPKMLKEMGGSTTKEVDQVDGPSEE